MTDLDLAIYAFGQSFNITPIQHMMAIAAVANGGYLLEPYLVEQITDESGNVTYQHESEVKRQVISKDVCEKLAVILEEGVSGDGGAKNVYVAYRRTRTEMPADPEEIEQAIEEGVRFRFLQNPVEILGEGGRVTGAKLQVMELGEPDASGRRSPVAVDGKFEYLDLDTVIEAIGQTLDFSGVSGIEYNKRGYICADEASFATAVEGVFAIGDATNRGASIAIEAIGEANRAARVIDSYLAGETVPYKKPFVSEQKASDIDFSGYEKKPRAQVVYRPADERKNDFCAITEGLTESQAIAEAKRCLECGCHDYSECRLIREARKEDIDPARLAGEKNRHPKERHLVCIERDNGKCILCSLCVRTCSENARRGLLGLVGRGFDTVIKPEFIGTDAIADCKSCRLCVDICPTGALKFID